jgi:hypothetical protein
MTFEKTKSGFHIVTQPFNLLKFKQRYPDVDVQKKNPTLLYFPDSLDVQEMEHFKDINLIGGLTMPDEPSTWWDNI